MELLTLAENDDIAIGGVTGCKTVVLRAADFSADPTNNVPPGAAFLAFTGSAADCAAHLDAGYFATATADFEGKMFYKSQYPAVLA